MRQRLRGNLADNAERWNRAQRTYREIAEAFDAAGLEYAVLKGFSHCPLFVSDPRLRRQGDIDFLLTPEQVSCAWDVAARLGYEPIVERDRHPTDHLPTLVRKTGWEWRGDFFDPEMPLSIELHFQLWRQETERLAPGGLDCFWGRRENRELDGLRFTGLHPADTIAYSTLHSLRHLLRGDPGLFHFYELAWLLHHRADDTALWSAWLELHDESLRRLEAICFALGHNWFGGRLPDVAREEIERLPPDVIRWSETFSWSPVAGMFQANKDELWLHWELLNSRRDRYRVLRRRLLPERLRDPGDAVHVPGDRLTWRIRLQGRMQYLRYVASRAGHHARALPSVAGSAIRWFGPRWSWGRSIGGYWRRKRFFDFGMFVFFFLYNLYLLQLGFRENFLGLMSGLMTAGNVAGSVLSVFAIRRFGMRGTLMTSFALTAGLCSLRASIVSGPALLASRL